MDTNFKKPARNIALIYIVVGSLWILLSDLALTAAIEDSQMIHRLQSIKGWLYILVTGALLYLLVRRSLNRLHAFALADTVTALPNRLAFMDELQQRCKKGTPGSQAFDISIIDVDHFQDLNDVHGHGEGDELLRAIGSTLQKQLGPDWYIARLGGDEFGLLSPPGLSPAQSREHLDKIQHNLGRASDYPPLANHTVSMGTCSFPSDGVSSRDLMRHADMALFNAKSHGRDQHCVYHEDIKERMMERLALIKDLRAATAQEAFDLVYQPQWSVSRQRWVGAEVLIRWNHPERGLVPPSEFIPLAEQEGLINRITDFVVRQSFKELLQAKIGRIKLPRLSINLSHLTLIDWDSMQGLIDLIKLQPKDRPELLLEITETATMENLTSTLASMQSWREEGVSFSIDDFGTGYSSLAMLKRLPLLELKIDRSFIKDLPEDRNDAVITQAILAMAQTLSLEVVAEGVETDEQADFLTRYGCDTMQGFHFARPMPVGKLKALLEQQGE